MKKIIQKPKNIAYSVKCKHCKCKYLATPDEFAVGMLYYHIYCPCCGTHRAFSSLRFVKKVKVED